MGCRAGGWLESSVFGVFLLLLLAAPLPLGSNRDWALGLLASGLWALLLLAWAALVWWGESPWHRLRVGRWPLLLMSAYACILVIQVLPVLPALPQVVAHRLAPSAVGAVISLDPYSTRRYLVMTLAYGAAFTLSLLLVRSERRLLLLAGAIVAGGVVQAWLAILLHAAHASFLYFFTPLDQVQRASGTYANWDHLAGYMELCLSVGIGLMFARMHGSEGHLSWRQRVVALLRFTLSRKMLVRLMLVIMVIALVLTHSRMGNGAFFIALLVVGCMAMLRNPRMRRGAFWLVASLVVIDSVIIGQWVGVDKVVERLQGTAVTEQQKQAAGYDQESLQARMRAPRWALDAVAERPWLGFGGGGFYAAFSRFKQAEWYQLFVHAHDDFVEIAVDTGLLGLCCLAGVVLLTLRRAWLLYGRHAPRVHRGMAFAVMMAAVCLLLHGVVDFNLQIPANALTFVVVLSLVWVIVPHVSEQKAASLRPSAMPVTNGQSS